VLNAKAMDESAARVSVLFPTRTAQFKKAGSAISAARSSQAERRYRMSPSPKIPETIKKIATM
jgi:hypothetical protein